MGNTIRKHQVHRETARPAGPETTDHWFATAFAEAAKRVGRKRLEKSWHTYHARSGKYLVRMADIEELIALGLDKKDVIALCEGLKERLLARVQERERQGVPCLTLVVPELAEEVGQAVAAATKAALSSDLCPAHGERTLLELAEAGAAINETANAVRGRLTYERFRRAQREAGR